jgi:hypothetical protein
MWIESYEPFLSCVVCFHVEFRMDFEVSEVSTLRLCFVFYQWNATMLYEYVYG